MEVFQILMMISYALPAIKPAILVRKIFINALHVQMVRNYMKIPAFKHVQPLTWPMITFAMNVIRDVLHVKLHLQNAPLVNRITIYMTVNALQNVHRIIIL